ncbi:MAG: hypothetical protein AAGI50_15760 [Pseudomonadota bacterium]
MTRDERLLAYMQNRLDPDDRIAFEADMAADPAVAAEVDVMRAVRAEFEERAEAPDAVAGWRRLEMAIEADKRRPANENRAPRLALWQVAAVVAAALLTWETAVAPQIGAERGGYATVSEVAAGPALRVAFVPSATIGEIDAILVDLGGTITDGPGALGLYRISFVDDAARDSAEAALAARTELVELVTAE